jgi:hypothetical protein
MTGLQVTVLIDAYNYGRYSEEPGKLTTGRRDTG